MAFAQHEQEPELEDQDEEGEEGEDTLVHGVPVMEPSLSNSSTTWRNPEPLVYKTVSCHS